LISIPIAAMVPQPGKCEWPVIHLLKLAATSPRPAPEGERGRNEVIFLQVDLFIFNFH